MSTEAERVTLPAASWRHSTPPATDPMPSRDDLGAYIVQLERENHRLKVELEQAEARARAWRRIAQWIHTAAMTRETP